MEGIGECVQKLSGIMMEKREFEKNKGESVVKCIYLRQILKAATIFGTDYGLDSDPANLMSHESVLL